MRKVTLWSDATSVDFRVSFGVDRRWPWAKAADGARVASASRAAPNRGASCEIMGGSFRRRSGTGERPRTGGIRLERAFDWSHEAETRGRERRHRVLRTNSRPAPFPAIRAGSIGEQPEARADARPWSIAASSACEWSAPKALP